MYAKGIPTMLLRLLLCAITATFVLSLQAKTFGADPNGGKQMYLQYCGSCHGRNGKGDGPVSRDLKVKVPDLTGLAKKHKGGYPLDDVMATIDGRRLVRGHGDREMPVWGENFSSEAEGKKYPELTVLLKAKIIAEYVGTLQKK
jgi:mono/diheme cytochrome c family protein